ncbi:MAG: hypothetical protein LBH32_11680 [Dysgonamonadaceae bacterium]|jgi:hypothetical protein|nr:hypothetical protein [Dysgonamonadaceae bacterium]
MHLKKFSSFKNIENLNVFVKFVKLCAGRAGNISTIRGWHVPLLRIENEKQLENFYLKGNLFENFVFSYHDVKFVNWKDITVDAFAT